MSNTCVPRIYIYIYIYMYMHVCAHSLTHTHTIQRTYEPPAFIRYDDKCNKKGEAEVKSAGSTVKVKDKGQKRIVEVP
jgi:hypothetical protein